MSLSVCFDRVYPVYYEISFEFKTDLIINWIYPIKTHGERLGASLAVTRPWLAVRNAFPTLSCILFKLKHSWDTYQTFILSMTMYELKMFPITIFDCI